MSADVLQPNPNFNNYPHLQGVDMAQNHRNRNPPRHVPVGPSVKVNMNDFDANAIIYDAERETTYLRGRLLGKGGFAKCYELLDLNSNKIYAGKIISKSRISKPHQRQKIAREVELHRDLKHKHIVNFHSFFEDDDHVYIVLENCNRKSLVHMLKHRKQLTEPEVRYFLCQLVDGVKYIHRHNIIHRDLKLGNMLLNENMDLKIADFGLATRVGYEGEKKMTVCGTPNYIAPEVLQKRGHSFEADVWALGCITYALLVGRPPFETMTLKETYIRITGNTYVLPQTLSSSAKNLIQKCLSHEPELRPSLEDILRDEFVTTGFLPKLLPVSCCHAVPRFPSSNSSKHARPKSYAVPDSKNDPIERLVASPLRKCEISQKSDSSKGSRTDSNESPPVIAFPAVRSPVREITLSHDKINRSNSPPRDSSPKPRSAANLLDVIHTCLEHMPLDKKSDPRSVGESGVVWVTKWVDYSNKYGFGFQLSNDVIGVLFNDTSRIVMSPDGRAMQYYDVTGKLSTFTVECVPEELEKKTTLMLYFARYMDEHLIQGGNLEVSKEIDETWNGNVFLKKWFRTTTAIVLYLNDGTLQVNFFNDHTKIILSYIKNDHYVTYIDHNRDANTYSMIDIIQDGCSEDVRERMNFAKSMLKNLVDIEGADI